MERYENHFKRTNELTPQAQKLIKIRQEVEGMVDNLGKGIEERIKETVVVLRALDYPTSSSCAGHTEIDGFAPPYVEIYTQPPVGWKESKDIQAQWKNENIKQKNRLLPVLEEFYKNRNVPDDVHLQLKDLGIFGGFRLMAKGSYMKAEELGVKSQEDVFNKIKLYQNEMSEFTDFIHKKSIIK